MNQLTRRFTALAVILIIINIIGLIWIRNDLARIRRQVARMVSIHLSPDETNPDRLTLMFDRAMVDYESVGKVEEKQLFTHRLWPESGSGPSRIRSNLSLTNRLRRAAYSKSIQQLSFKPGPVRKLTATRTFTLKPFRWNLKSAVY